MGGFGKDFVWSVASASYQVEGATSEDGRGESIWDRYCSIPGNILNGENGNIACDHYHRYKQDIALMKEIGVNGYRFSISWPRIIPEGTGVINKKGIGFYEDLIDELIKNGIEPYVTLYHWDLPQALQDQGGWANPAIVDAFLEYAKIVMNRFNGKVKHWITLNEPYCVAFLGNYVGRQAPGITDFSTALRVAYFEYVAHGKVVSWFRENNISGEIGIALNLMGRLPYSDSQENIEAAKRADGYLNRWFIEPIMFGRYPQDMIEWYQQKGVVLPPFDEQEIALMNQQLDFIGLNYYNDFHVVEDKSAWPIDFSIKNRPFVPVNSRQWPITEGGLFDMLMRMKNEYGVDRILITENGTSTIDTISVDGAVHDSERVDYLARHVAVMRKAIANGVNLIGYNVWSITDNFEWSFGYDSRFGLVYIDYATQKRILKDSGKWYRDLIKEERDGKCE
jgi:beta-glucosidase